ncbi:ABC transporter substrate-binding protein [Cardiobacteriaceae bacterium TAE3-ERU3]|nr:ABC transporter substrate-binding protein [Cardiobacteriaceae bacterium TAE3-ERU3]
MKKSVLCLMLTLSLAASAESPQRIVSTSGNASEVVVRLGLAENLVAVDTTSLLPFEVMQNKPKIGYRRHLSAEGILSMAPDLVILAPDAGPPAVVKQLENSGLPLFYIKDEQTLDGINDDIIRLGEVLDRMTQAQELVAQQLDEEKALDVSKAAYPRLPELVVLLDTGSGIFGLGKNSAGEHIANILGGDLSLDFEGMKPMSNEILALNNADAVLVALRNESDDSSIIKPLAEGRYEVLDSHPAMQDGCVFQVNIMKTLGFGPDTAATAQEIAEKITPCIKKEK